MGDQDKTLFLRGFDFARYPSVFGREVIRNSFATATKLIWHSLTLPTTFRKSRENELDESRMGENNRKEFVNSGRLAPYVFGSTVGMIAGTIAGLVCIKEGLDYSLQSLADGNYTGTIVFAGANALSGVYELGRFSVKKSLEAISKRKVSEEYQVQRSANQDLTPTPSRISPEPKLAPPEPRRILRTVRSIYH